MLLVLGLYQTLLDAASTMNIYILAPIGIGTLVGTFLTARVIEWLLNRFPQPTYLLILGFVLGSIVEIFPGWPQGYFEWFIGLSVFAIGFLFVYKTSKI
jgi:putative membrane protein